MVLKKGGIRQNAGRKELLNKKIVSQVYMSKDLKKKIDSLNIYNCKSFSKKCLWLIERGIEQLPVEKSKTNKKVIRFIDLFAGLGGIRIGFENSLKDHGFIGDAVFVSEIKKSAIKTYCANFPGEKITGDITKVKSQDIPDFDYLLAGFPCQAFSSAGNRLGFEDTRGTLFFDVARILREKKPKGFLLENVEGLVNHDHGKTFKVIKKTLLELGYNINYRVLSGDDFGLAQARKRIYIVGTLQSKKINLDNFRINNKAVLNDIIDNNVLPTKDKFTFKLLKHYNLKELEGKSIKDKRGGQNNIHSWDFNLRGEVTKKEKELLNILLKQRRKKKWASVIGIDWMDGMPLSEETISTFFSDPNLHSMLLDLVKKGYLVYEYPKKLVGHRRQYDKSLKRGYNIVTGKLSFQYSKILNPYERTPTLVATDISHLAVPVKDGLRKLTVREGLRLFGFPESYKMTDDIISVNKAYDLLGNTVCVPVIKAVSDRLLDVCEGHDN